MPHTIAEEIMLPSAIELVRRMKGNAAQHLKLLLLSDDLLENKFIILPSNLRSIFLCNVHLSPKFTRCFPKNLSSY